MEFPAKARTCMFFHDEAEAAARFYAEVIPDSRVESVVRAGEDGPVFVVEFTVAGAPLMALNGNSDFRSTHAFSISVLTEDQAETDRLWSGLLAGGGKEGQCGWLTDRFGVHWQVVPKQLPRLMRLGAEAGRRVQAALMTMKKIDVAELEAAAAGA